MDLNEVGRRIKDRRKYMNLTQKDVADMVNTSQSNYALKAAHEEAQRKQKVHGRKAE